MRTGHKRKKELKEISEKLNKLHTQYGNNIPAMELEKYKSDLKSLIKSNDPQLHLNGGIGSLIQIYKILSANSTNGKASGLIDKIENFNSPNNVFQNNLNQNNNQNNNNISHHFDI
ncbi:hypothetical protein [Piscirickettsia litoralis]|uniref:Uncharacterized protein n=1 Tax=Piscirickettsia litoralis TaxID=1891921 RepID=A0ABX3A1T2_9GAMM|nr:hypothetical protein [Piscirickettsia litoralis]ODN42450.1 hypothetical protein BGC07_05275 [Piscirickettsia litoralis]